nr:anthranilate synthase component I family protein [Woodsholea maritima]
MIELSWRCPLVAFAPLKGVAYSQLLYGGGAKASGRFSYICAFPDFTIEDEDAARGFSRLREQARPLRGQGEGFHSGYCGLMAYDLGQAFETVPRLSDGISAWPKIAMGWYGAVAVFDHDEKSLIVRGVDPDACARLADALGAAALPAPTATGQLDQVWSDGQYLNAAARARDYVRAGDIFQVNLSHAFQGAIKGEAAPYDVFRRLAQTSAAGFSAYFCLDERRVIVTNSPERFLKFFETGRVEARPIKGTRARGKTPEADARAREALEASLKDRAENLMIVDLMRNDLARVCQAGSVKVPELFKVESFANVHHLVSTIEGQLQPGRDVYDLLAASFPPGSITGAPKCRAMEIIAELEGVSRGAYCGAMGWLDGAGSADLNVMIRTLSCVRHGADWTLEARSGGAITIDSQPQHELDETHAKLAAIRAALEG